MCQDVLLLIGLQIIFVLIVIQLCHLFSLQIFSNLLMILTSIYCFNKFNSFSHLYRGVSWSFFYFVFHADRYINIWYATVGIFNCLIRYVSPTVRHCWDINFFNNLLSKTKSYLALLLFVLIFCFGVKFFFCLSFFHLLFFFIKTDSVLIIPMKHPS